MSNIRSLKRRIKSAKNIKQITKAMEMVSASKMRKSQAQALASRPYARKLETTLNTIASLVDESTTHPLLEQPASGKDAVIILSTDKSLAGSLNTNLFRGAHQYIEQFDSDPEIIIVGQKARQFTFSIDASLYAEFTNLPDPLSYADSLPISKLIIDNFTNHTFRSVHVVYMDFVSTLVQKVRSIQLLPLSIDTQSLDDSQTNYPETNQTSQYIFEPSTDEILDWLLPYYVELYVYQLLLEARASEHSARMVSMKNASENATEIISDLTLSFNKARQAGITAELLDNATAAMIVK